MNHEIAYRVRHAPTNEALHELFAVAWREQARRDLMHILSRSLTFVCGFVSTAARPMPLGGHEV